MASLISVSTQSAVVPCKREDIEQTLHERMAIIGPYLEALEKVKSSFKPSSSDRQTFDVLYRLVQMTEISQIKHAERVSDFHLRRAPLILAELEGQR
ncbi:hypothetical protein [Edaphobacter modestus]|uniref:Uncharacterized protein n=1 Tax=Edaphobacter modestus TaxID=388466 RepID=A0A4Q7XZT2_9BACT|nr:hypothetical protein [Edaphobacter modestus]RZU29083.1 hypothetical protein BDD14_6678 [Edaphobacter modestus]